MDRTIAELVNFANKSNQPKNFLWPRSLIKTRLEKALTRDARKATRNASQREKVQVLTTGCYRDQTRPM